MEITLEKIELVKDRTGVGYKEAKEALEACDGSVVDAIIAIEEAEADAKKSTVSGKAGEVVNKVKELVKKGNVSRIVVKKDEETVLNLPLNAGILGVVIAPWGILAGTIAAFGTKCKIELVKDDGTIVDVSDTAAEKFEDAKVMGANLATEAMYRGEDMFNDLKEKAEGVIDRVRYGKDTCDGDCEACEDEECEDREVPEDEEKKPVEIEIEIGKEE